MMFLLLETTAVAAIIWASIFILAGIIEASTMDMTSIWFAAGALVALILDIFGVDIYIQIIAFVIVSAATLLSLRPLFARYLKKNDIKTNVDRLVGKTAVCTVAIIDGERGEVRIDGKIWTAISENDVAIGEKVKVLAIEGVKLVVKKEE